MASYYFQFITVFILLTGIQEGLSVNNENHQIIDMSILLSRLEQLEAKVVKVDQLEAKVAKVDQHELKINTLQIEIEQLKKKNLQLEEQNQLVLSGAVGKLSINDDITSRDFLPRSCYEIKATNPSAQSGEYSIDPDGQIGGDSPIQVYCDMATQTTSIYHDTEAKTDVPSCADPGCYTKAIKYSASARQLLMLADISASCKQYFRFDSFVVPLEFNLTQYGYWNDRNGGKQIFWAGPATSTHTCQCGISNSCVERNYKCNADALAPLDVVDEGFITATELLPVTRLNFGRTSVSGVKASYTLGRFECTGQAPISSKPTNCRDLFKMGHTLSGFYDIKGSSTQIASTYCDFSKSSTETGYETRYGFVDVKSAPIHFFVVRSSRWSTLNVPITFNVEKLNLGGGMNMVSGVFTVPKAGIYAFHFKGSAAGLTPFKGYAQVSLQRNGAHVAFGDTHIDGGTISSAIVTVFVHANLKLSVGDQITIALTAGEIYDSGNYNTQFVGSLLEEDLAIS